MYSLSMVYVVCLDIDTDSFSSGVEASVNRTITPYCMEAKVRAPQVYRITPGMLVSCGTSVFLTTDSG